MFFIILKYIVKVGIPIGIFGFVLQGYYLSIIKKGNNHEGAKDNEFKCKYSIL